MFTSGCRLMFGTSLAFTWVVCLLINPSAACSSCLPISFGNKVQQSHYKRPLKARSDGPFMSMEDSSPPGCATAPWEVRKPEGSERMSDFFPLHVHGHIDSAWSIFHQRCWIHFFKKMFVPMWSLSVYSSCSNSPAFKFLFNIWFWHFRIYLFPTNKSKDKSKIGNN